MNTESDKLITDLQRDRRMLAFCEHGRFAGQNLGHEAEASGGVVALAKLIPDRAEREGSAQPSLCNAAPIRMRRIRGSKRGNK